jgi:secreted trypsin-like serine protease
VFLLIFLKIPQIFSEDYCGKVYITSGLVVNGELAQKGEFPFLVPLYTTKDEKFFCAGNLITRRHVVSGKRREEKRNLKNIF